MTGPQTGRGRTVKGNRAENDVVRWLREFRGFDAERVRSGRSTDAGDVVWPGSGWHVDIKDRQRWQVGAWFTEAEAEVDADPPPRYMPLLILKRPGITDPGRWLSITRLEDMEL